VPNQKQLHGRLTGRLNPIAGLQYADGWPRMHLFFRAQGPQVVTFTRTTIPSWQKISVPGATLAHKRNAGCLKDNTEVRYNPTDDLREGIKVQVKRR